MDIEYGDLIADRANWALTHKQRRKGLSGIDVADAPKALYFDNCRSIHTFGMKFSLRVLYFDKNLDLLDSKIVRPHKFIRSPKGTRSILEIPCKLK